MKFVLISITIFFIISQFTGCTDLNSTKSDNEKNKFIGTWEYNDQFQKYEFIFYKNNSFYSYYIYYFDDGEDETHEGWGNYKIIEKNTIKMNTSHGKGGLVDEETYEYTFSDNNDFLTLSSSRYPDFKLSKIQ